MRFSSAVGVSVAVHAALGVGLCTLVLSRPSGVEAPELDLSGVELSFAEEERDEAAALPVPPTPSPEQPSPEPSDAPPEPPEPLPEMPPDPDLVPLPEPKDEIPKMYALPVEQTPDESVPAPRQARVDAPLRPVRSIRPDYPLAARRRGEQGRVVLEIRVDVRGAVEDVSVAETSGFPELDAAAERAARSAKFIPARAGGAPVASAARLSLDFRLK